MTDQTKNNESPAGLDMDALIASMDGAPRRLCKSSSSSYAAPNGGVTPNSTASSTEFELRGTTNEESPTGKARSPGKVLIRERAHRPVCDEISSDDKSGIVDKEVGEKLRTRALCLTIHMWNAVTRKPEYYEGQAFIVQNPNQDQSKKLCTAKHNLVSDKNKNGEMEFCRSHMIAHPEGFEIDIQIPGTGWTRTDTTAVVLRDNHMWSSGRDISLAPPLDVRSILHDPALLELEKSAGAYDAVGRDFRYRKGMYVAIVAYSKTGATPEKLEDNDLDEANFPKYFGNPMEIMINTGKITHVGDDHIEYNTVAGLLGRLLFSWRKVLTF